MHNHQDQDALITEILSQMAQEKRKSLDRIKQLLLIDKNQAISRQFWALLDKKTPNHTFEYVGCCPLCGLFELCETPPQIY